MWSRKATAFYKTELRQVNLTWDNLIYYILRKIRGEKINNGWRERGGSPALTDTRRPALTVSPAQPPPHQTPQVFQSHLQTPPNWWWSKSQTDLPILNTLKPNLQERLSVRSAKLDRGGMYGPENGVRWQWFSRKSPHFQINISSDVLVNVYQPVQQGMEGPDVECLQISIM